ncbi:MAG: hypothetical protein HY000_36600 [Planctomycetes bacterium]|nr:hypothetical protein [Planctomycetota bacterium]
MSHSRAPFVQCEGWWEQVWYGRQPMHNLRLTFEHGRVQGSGVDMVGPFTFSGMIAENGAVTMRKQYIGMHSVEYMGMYDGEGLMAGEWRIEGFRGPWLIRIGRATSAAAKEIQEIVAVQ